MLALHMTHVIIRDREDDDTCWLAHGDCADRVVLAVNDQVGYARLFVYGPTTETPATCAATDCPH